LLHIDDRGLAKRNRGRVTVDDGASAATPVDPTGPATGTNRVFRGGSWYIAVPDIMRAAVRYQSAPTFSVGDVGILCAGAASAP
jgi:formylglycine-generating enzyme required for sulfatase activity